MCSQQAESVTTESPESGPIGLRAYARHRQCSLGAVQRAIKSARLTACVVRDASGQPRILSAAAADAEWQAATLATRRPVRSRTSRSSPPGPSAAPVTRAPATPAMDYTAAQTRLATVRAELEELKRDQLRGELVSVERVHRMFTNALVIARTRLLGIPNKIGQRHPEATRSLIATVEAEIREALEALADTKNDALGL